MDKQTDSDELTAEQKTRLLSLGFESDSSPEVSDTDDPKADLLYDIMNNPLPVDAAQTDSLPLILKRQCRKLRSITGDSLRNLLLNPGVDVSILNKIKDFARQLGTSAKTKNEYDVSLAIYHAAIAGGLVFHEEKITNYSYSELEQSFDSLNKQIWIYQELRQLFTKACQVCNRESKN